ncbi:alpha/beta hydrolase [Brevundimonas naejangsanensis]
MRVFNTAATIAMFATGALLLGACGEKADAVTATSNASASADGAPYVLQGTQVWSVPDPVSGRNYQVFVSLPASYEAEPNRRYPVLYVTDADYAFPIIRQIARRVNLEGPVVQDFILVGLSYAEGDKGAESRRRDYTPTPNGPNNSAGYIHGGGAAYQTYLKSQALPFIEQKFRADPTQRVLLGHSYGGLLGAQILFSDPAMFSGYVLGSPSLWYDKRHMLGAEADYARTHDDLKAQVFMYVGGYEVPGPDRRNTSGADLVADMKTLQGNLLSRNYPGLKVSSIVLEDEDHLTVAPIGFTRALEAVLPAR